MKNLKDMLVEGFYKNVGNKDLKAWYDQNDYLMRSTDRALKLNRPSPIYVDRDTDELVVTVDWTKKVRISILKYLEYLKDYKFCSTQYRRDGLMVIVWGYIPVQGEHMEMSINIKESTITLERIFRFERKEICKDKI